MRKRHIRIRKTISCEPMSDAQWQGVERLIARLIAKAYWADLQSKSHEETPAAPDTDRDTAQEERATDSS